MNKKYHLVTLRHNLGKLSPMFITELTDKPLSEYFIYERKYSSSDYDYPVAMLFAKEITEDEYKANIEKINGH